MKTYSIRTFGCYANEVDSDLMAGMLDGLGFSELKVPKFRNYYLENKYILENADVFIVNTCSVRQKSEDKVYGLGKVFNSVKNKKPVAILAGCMVGSASGDRRRIKIKDLKVKTPFFDYYISPEEINEIPSILRKEGLIKNDTKVGSVTRRQKDRKHAYVNISYGCDNFCAYCVVPYSRGAEISRDEKEIVDEVKCLLNSGIKEITLCGQNVNSWGLDRSSKFKLRSGGDQKLPFTRLLKKVSGMGGLEKLDFISSNPFDFTKDLIKILDNKKISNYFHIAVQSGNNEVLKAMGRRHTVEEFIKLIDEIKKVRSDAEFGTDVIVGFPGETEDQFMDTVNLFKRVKFSVAFINMYSPRKGTFAEANLKDNVSLKEKKRRHKYLTEVWKANKP